METLNEKKKQFVVDTLKDYSVETLVELWNRYCSDDGNMDDYIYENTDDFFEENFQGRVSEAVRACFYGDYRYCDPYVYFNAYANLNSFEYMGQTNPIDIDYIADYLFDVGEDDDIDPDELANAYVEAVQAKYPDNEFYHGDIDEVIEKINDVYAPDWLTDDWDEIYDDINTCLHESDIEEPPVY